MKFPEIPTDNLYKFMATSGIVIIITSFVPLFYQHKLRMQYIQFSGEIVKLAYENESLIEDAEKFANVKLDGLRKRAVKLSEDFQSRIKKSWFNIISRKDFNTFKDGLENLQVELLEAARETEEITNERERINDLIIQLGIKKAELSYLSGIINTGLDLFRFGVISGIVLTFLGFLLWYQKLQFPLDKIIKNKSKNIQDNR